MNKIFGVLLLVLLASCQSDGPHRETFNNPDYDVSDYKTVAWESDKPFVFMGVMSGGIPADFSNRVQGIVKTALLEKGYVFVSRDEEPDMLAVILAGAGERAAYSEHSYTENNLRNATVVWSQINEYLQAGLSVELKEPQEGETIWQGSASRRIKDRETRHQNGRVISEFVAELMQGLPAATAL